jgi:hypothetical protein
MINAHEAKSFSVRQKNLKNRGSGPVHTQKVSFTATYDRMRLCTKKNCPFWSLEAFLFGLELPGFFPWYPE